MESCKDCKFSSKSNVSITYLECRRNPPRVVTDPRKPAQFPLVTLDDWCGELKNRSSG